MTHNSQPKLRTGFASAPLQNEMPDKKTQAELQDPGHSDIGASAWTIKRLPRTLIQKLKYPVYCPVHVGNKRLFWSIDPMGWMKIERKSGRIKRLYTDRCFGHAWTTNTIYCRIPIGDEAALTQTKSKSITVTNSDTYKVAFHMKLWQELNLSKYSSTPPADHPFDSDA